MAALDDDIKPKLLKQVEFYFSDSNLPKDKFLRGQVEAHPEGYVDMSLILSFARMRELLKLGQAKPEDVSDDMITAVAEVLRGSTALVVSESGFQVRRATALPTAKEAARAVDSRSLYVRPFPMMATLDSIVAYFQGCDVDLNAVRLRRHTRSKEFKGSVFLEAVSPEESERVLSLQLEFEGAPLRMERKKDYLARKILERKQKNIPGTVTLAVLEEMDSDCEIAALTQINSQITLPEQPAPEAAQQEQQQEQQQQRKRKQPDSPPTGGGADDDADEGDVRREAAASEQPPVEAPMEEFEPGCIVCLSLEGCSLARIEQRQLVQMVKEAMGGFSKVRFVEKLQQQQQQPPPPADVQQQQQQLEEGRQGKEAEEQQQDDNMQEADQQQQQGTDHDAQKPEPPAADAAEAAEAAEAAGPVVFMVRFREAAAASAAVAEYSAGDQKVLECTAVMRLVKDEEEVDYYKRAAATRAAAAKRHQDSSGGWGGRGGRGGRGVRGGGRGGGRLGGRGGRFGNKRGRGK